MSILSVEHVIKTYGEKILFDDISFTISEKQKIGLIGVNGTGKSTLLRVIAGLDSVEKGDIIHANQFHIEYLPQDPQFEEDLSVLEQIYYGNSSVMVTLREYELALMDLEQDPNNQKKQEALFKKQQKMDLVDAWEANTTAKTVLTRLGITNYTEQVKNLSGGQRKKVAIAKALIQPADLLILDEPTNHLDNETIEWLEGYLSKYQSSFILVTHDRYFLNRVTNGMFELDNGKLYVYEGNYETFLEKKAEREEQAIIDDSKRKNLLRKELAWLRRGAKARTTKQKARIQRVNELQNKKTIMKEDSLDISIGSNRLGKKVFEIEELSKTIDEKILIEHFSYLVVPDERLGIIGPNGSGKSTLLNILAGKIRPERGSIEVGETVRIGYYTQNNEELDGNLRVVEYIKQKAEIVKTADGSTITAEQMLERFLFPRSIQWTYIRKLSGGERRRLYLLSILMLEPNVLLLDEPTNDLDIQTLTILEDYLEVFAGVVISVSHDRYFLDRVVDHLICFEGNGVITRFQGNYTEYMEMKSTEREKQALEKQNQEDVSKQINTKVRRKKLSYKEQIEWDEIEDKITEIEQRISEIETEIVEAGSDSEKVSHLYEEQQKTEEILEQTMARWEELSLIIEEIEQN
ncbi:ABC-F family ATP-binding cassette domain-containing protein [Chengkuizengella marina]|uniref:ATP-binding cassette domain-containing protein n=1 Tax=Chengkuizengella marina TaxID=2507566 RepID=A0A6N9Q395_9BACL|nr:ABC-F family ATP-binding cassette domain-containing protein [Chengkuizengella marina]NBI29256.1 ATP-binding cassette domain-containing protein [Chengkuizengella marina]